MTNQEVAQAFADGATKGKSLNMFIDGDTVYSYGYHFPIARRTSMTYRGKEVILFTNKGYSNTTAKHISHVRYALLNHALLEVDHESGDQGLQLTPQISLLTSKLQHQRLKECESKVSRARVASSKEMWDSQKHQVLNQMDILREVAPLSQINFNS